VNAGGISAVGVAEAGRPHPASKAIRATVSRATFFIVVVFS
jgi:hypothetical protein